MDCNVEQGTFRRETREGLLDQKKCVHRFSCTFYSTAIYLGTGKSLYCLPKRRISMCPTAVLLRVFRAQFRPVGGRLGNGAGFDFTGTKQRDTQRHNPNNVILWPALSNHQS
ncbi:KAT8 regulatory NSL complex subunit 1-like protein [Platysternon megacephalum]|uniref:KAT8 regulatory NSL complex subunit 1-like protein n=1 Tax=Platysternon megacephalum TaxID=55544 RepID=A0A4D9EZC5_9SAUR|nr:KAT8 regulatory NSL complex subunit 1-like protein [Platysternon megacephalum]